MFFWNLSTNQKAGKSCKTWSSNSTPLIDWHEAATQLLFIDLYSVSIYCCCLFEGISLCFTLSLNQIKSERSHSLSRIGWSRPRLRWWGFEPLNYLTNDFLNPVKMKRHYPRLTSTAPTERSASNFTLRLSKTPKNIAGNSVSEERNNPIWIFPEVWIIS